ncbi:MAG: ABC transporter ATP-binding protein [Saprospiraceae bacterium]|nr:ABC transporter ATP-binding protein [Saprospiraceae bacterium]
MNHTILQIKDVSKVYPSGQNNLTVLEDINFSINQGETLSIVGPSGSGKTTLLGLCAGLDYPSEGEVILDGQSLNNLSENERALIRNQKIGFIFQDFQLIPTLTAIENVAVPLELRGDKTAMPVAEKLLARVGLSDRSHHYPSQLSGGEQQRICIARAFSSAPAILFADEPTGNLDDETGSQIEALLFALNHEEGTTLVIVTHDLDLANRTNRIIRLKGGHVISDQYINSVHD